MRWVKKSAHDYVEIARVMGERMRGRCGEIARAIDDEKRAWKHRKIARRVFWFPEFIVEFLQDSEEFY